MKFFKWLERPETVKKFKKLGVGKENIFVQCGRPNETIPEQGLKFVDRVPKGVYIQRASSELHRKNKPDYCICIDGEGIDFDYVLSILTQLVTQPILGAIACRKNNLNLGNKDRETVEKFELYIVSKIFGTKLFDGQCGCWGFKKEFWNVTNLEGEYFEIELDFLIKLLKVGKEIAYVPVEIYRAPNDISTFKLSDHRIKLEFICKLLKRVKEEINGYIVAFERENGPLPLGYKKEIENIGYEPINVEIICSGRCSTCQYVGIRRSSKGKARNND